MMAVLRGLEGAGGRAYWGAVGTVLRSHGVPWTGREYRGTGNAFNAALNYGYGILASQVQTAVHLAGLDPGAGFLHADRAGRSSLVLDAIEEFRQAVVDRPLIGLASRRVAFRMIPGWHASMIRRGGWLRTPSWNGWTDWNRTGVDAMPCAPSWGCRHRAWPPTCAAMRWPTRRG